MPCPSGGRFRARNYYGCVYASVDADLGQGSRFKGQKQNGSRFRPVFNLQSRHTLELVLVVGNKYPSLGFGMGSDP